jgi:hypothetical protein
MEADSADQPETGPPAAREDGDTDHEFACRDSQSPCAGVRHEHLAPRRADPWHRPVSEVPVLLGIGADNADVDSGSYEEHAPNQGQPKFRQSIAALVHGSGDVVLRT